MSLQGKPADGRTRRRLETMRRAQTEAIALFRARGYDGVTVDEVARAAGVGVASLFRNFGTKENLVLWDEYDPMLFATMARQLESGASPVRAIEAAITEALGEVYARDRRRILARADLVASTPALAAAGRANVQLLRDGLEQVLRPAVKDPLERALAAAAFTATLEVTIERWRLARGRMKLQALLGRAFQALLRLGFAETPRVA